LKHWFEDIYQQHRQGLYSLALSVTRQPAAAEDAVHDAAVRLIHKAEAPAGDSAAYVFRSVRNAAIDQVRRRQTQGLQTEGLFADPAPGPYEQATGHEQRQRLMDAVNALPQAQREAIVMRIFGQLTFQQIADANQQPLSTVASRYQRGLTRLKQTMENSHERAQA